MVSESGLRKLAALLDPLPIEFAYHLHPLPPGTLTAARGGLAVSFEASTSSSQRYDFCQKVRYQLMGVLPPGHTEVLSLNDVRIAVAHAAVSRGTVVYDRHVARRLQFEVIVLGQAMDFDTTIARYLGSAASPAGRTSR